MRDDLVSLPDSAAYRAATTPHNAAVVQRPAMVAHPGNATDVADAVQWAARHDLRVAVQSSGHGAGAPIGPDHLLVDTSGLTSVEIDGRVARVGAGATWSAVNAVAERDGLLGLAGSSPTVGVAGYTFGGGVGYLTRPHGMASSALLAVDYVDGNGQTRRATEDADDVVDREALWAFRGGGGVGVATALTVELVEPPELWAGYQLWSIDALGSVAEAWATAMAQIGDALSTSLSVLHTPPDAPAFTPELRGVPVVHLSFASPEGAEAARPLLEALRAARPPVVDSSWAPADAARLAQIHLDPPNPVAALGMGRWLGQDGFGAAGEMLSTAAAADSPLAMVELRNLDNAAPTRDGALTAVPGPLLLHAVGDAADDSARTRIEDGLARLRDTAVTADLGRSSAPFSDGRAADPGGLDQRQLTRLAGIAGAVDPHRRLAPSRILASTTDVSSQRLPSDD